MNETRFLIFRIFVAGLLIFHIPIFGFPQATELSDSLKTEIRALEMVQIPEFGKNTMNLIKDIRLIVDNHEKLDDILPGLEHLLAVLDKKDSVLSDTLNIFRLDDLDKEDRELELLNQRIIQWKTTVLNHQKIGQNKDSVASLMINIWQLTLDSIDISEKRTAAKINTTEKADDIKTEIVNFISGLQTAQNDLHVYLEGVQNIQTEITIAENKLGHISNLIDSRSARLNQSIWLPDYPPVWEVKKDTVEVNPTERLLNFIDTNNIGYYLKNKHIIKL